MEAFWSPALACDSKMRRQKQPLLQQLHLPRRNRARTFLSQAGPQVVLRFSQAGHHSSGWTVEPPSKRRRRPSRVALARSWYAASCLARAPPGEGVLETEPAIAGDRLQARRSIRDRGRFGLRQMAVPCDRHRVYGGMPRRNIVQTRAQRKGQFTKSRRNYIRIVRYFFRSTARSSAALSIFERPSIPSFFASL